MTDKVNYKMSDIKYNCSNVNICFAVDDNYAPYLKVALYSLLQNRNRGYFYNIIILHTQLSSDSMKLIMSVAKDENQVEVNFTDVSALASGVDYEINTYVSIATNYRLLLFSDMFKAYDRMLYLDCDIIVDGDIGKLYFEDMNDSLAVAVEETDFRQLGYCKKAVFLDKSNPYNVDNYRTDALKMKHPETYFNAGVILLDLEKCRKEFDVEYVFGVLQRAKYHYNDQDVLNIIFDGKVKLVDYIWNYHNNVEFFCSLDPKIYGALYTDVRRKKPNIIHYVSSKKPWNEIVPMGEYYKSYKEKSDLCGNIDIGREGKQ
ncbi:MAG: glycosyltransferase family 8 protein [Lachnospiraceae bacterium]|nr:glycosyltransferase family 8 protein [Candidatus Colinaster equi]